MTLDTLTLPATTAAGPATRISGPEATTDWMPVCRLAHLIPGRGVAALVDGRAVALFRVSGSSGIRATDVSGDAADPAGGRHAAGTAGAVFAIGNHDPYADASVLSRGLVGSIERDGELVPYVASPLRKHRFDLCTGRSLDDPAVTVGTWPVRVAGGVVHVASPDSSWRNDLETVA